MKKIILATMAAVSLGAGAVSLGAGAVKAAWDDLQQEKSVSVLIGQKTNLSNVSITGGDLTKTLVPRGAALGSNDVYELDLGTLTYTKSSNISSVTLEMVVYADGNEVEQEIFQLSYSDGEAGNGDIYNGISGGSIGDSISMKFRFDNNGDYNNYDEIIEKYSGKSLTIVLNLIGQKA